jgi:hypothetical protein
LADVVMIAREAIFSAASLGCATVHTPAKAKIPLSFRRCRNGCLGCLRSSACFHSIQPSATISAR